MGRGEAWQKEGVVFLKGGKVGRWWEVGDGGWVDTLMQTEFSSYDLATVFIISLPLSMVVTLLKVVIM